MTMAVLPLIAMALGSATPLDAATAERLAAQHVAHCAVDRVSGGVRSTLTEDPLRTLPDAAMSRIADVRCLPEDASLFPRAALRGALFVDLYRRTQMPNGDRVMQRFPAAAVDMTRLNSLNLAAAGAEVTGLWLGECIVAADPDGARAVVTAPTASPEQDRAFAKLKTSMGGCVPRGAKMSLSKGMVEGAIGEALYRPRTGMAATPASAESEKTQ